MFPSTRLIPESNDLVGSVVSTPVHPVSSFNQSTRPTPVMVLVYAQRHTANDYYIPAHSLTPLSSLGRSGTGTGAVTTALHYCG